MIPGDVAHISPVYAWAAPSRRRDRNRKLSVLIASFLGGSESPSANYSYRSIVTT